MDDWIIDLTSIASGLEMRGLVLIIPSGNLHWHPALSAHISKLRGIKTRTSGIFTELQVGPCQDSFPMQEQAFHFLFVAFSFLRCKFKNATLRGGEHAAIWNTGSSITVSATCKAGRWPLAA
jgi:hypothetical protein